MLTHPLITGEPWHGYDTWEPPSLKKTESTNIDVNVSPTTTTDSETVSPHSPQSQYAGLSSVTQAAQIASAAQAQQRRLMMLQQMQSRSLPGSRYPSNTNSPLYPSIINAPNSHPSVSTSNNIHHQLNRLGWHFSPPRFSNIRIMKAKRNDTNNGQNQMNYTNIYRSDRSNSYTHQHRINFNNNNYNYARAQSFTHNQNHNHNSYNRTHGHRHSHNHRHHQNRKNLHSSNNNNNTHFSPNYASVSNNQQARSYPTFSKNPLANGTNGSVNSLSVLASLPRINTNLNNGNNHAQTQPHSHCSSVASSLHHTPVSPNNHLSGDAFANTMGHLNLINDTSPDGVCNFSNSLSHSNNLLIKKNMVQQTPVRPQLQQPTFPSQLIDLRNMDLSNSVRLLPQSTAFGAQSHGQQLNGSYGVSPFSLQTSPNMNPSYNMAEMQMPPAMVNFIPPSIAQFNQQQQQQAQYNLSMQSRNSPQNGKNVGEQRERRSIWM